MKYPQYIMSCLITDPGKDFFLTNGKYQNLPINKMCRILQQAVGVIKKERREEGKE
jgi:hypothetical protein